MINKHITEITKERMLWWQERSTHLHARRHARQKKPYAYVQCNNINQTARVYTSCFNSINPVRGTALIAKLVTFKIVNFYGYLWFVMISNSFLLIRYYFKWSACVPRPTKPSVCTKCWIVEVSLCATNTSMPEWIGSQFVTDIFK